jgi:hypothetical protein
MREALAAGTRLGRYEIVTLLGAGGMGEVYRARDHELQRQVAIKIRRALNSAERRNCEPSSYRSVLGKCCIVR